jgi:hypothetical protein
MATQTAPQTNGHGSGESEAPAPIHLDRGRFGEPGTGTLDERIARIGGLLQVHADRKMTGGDRTYSYASINALAAAVTPLLAAEGVSIIPTKTRTTTDVKGREKTGRDGPYTQYRHHAHMVVTWRIGGGGESQTATSEGYSADPEGSEKHVNQASSFARVNLYKMLFHIATDEDPEQKGSGGGGGSSAAEGVTGTGELPTFEADVWARVMVGEGGRIGVKSGTDSNADFAAMRDMWKGLGGSFDREKKLWIYPADKAATVIDVARGYGFTIAEALEAQYPAAPPPQAAAPSSDMPAAPTQSDADRAAAESWDASQGTFPPPTGTAGPGTDPHV